ncbi:hypothetical protein Tco_1175957 [Tanacetum coccineum]
MDTSKRGYIPMQERLDLNKTHGASTPEEVKRMQNVLYASTIGSIITILKYLTNTKDMFLVYGGNPEVELQVDCYCNAGFETNRDDIKSQTGYVFILNGGAVDWKSSKQSTTAINGSFRQNALSSASKTFFERVNIDGPNFNDGIGLKNCLEKTPAVEDLRSGSTFYKVANGQGKSVSEHVLEMKGLMDQLHTLGKPYDNDMAVNLINRSLNKDFGDFGLKDKVTPTPQVFSIQKGRDNKSKPQGNKQKKGKGKADKNKQVVPSQPKPNPKKRKEKPY